MKQYQLKCDNCQQVFSVDARKHARAKYDTKTKGAKHFCTTACRTKCLGRNLPVPVTCLQCNKTFLKRVCELKKTPNSFCNKSCAATYNNTHKTYGTRRSKLEAYLEEQLTDKYQGIEFDFNKKEAINSELDIYIPSLRLAFELNGIYHYEPIHGDKKLSQIQNNDSRKFQACLERGIELCIIDTSSLSYFKPANAKKYLDIVCTVIDLKLSNTKKD